MTHASRYLPVSRARDVSHSCCVLAHPCDSVPAGYAPFDRRTCKPGDPMPVEIDLEDLQRWWWIAQAFFYIQAVMTIWMLIDAYQRGADGFWFFIILLFQPLGPWAYLLMVKVRAGAGMPFGEWKLLEKRVSLEELRYRVQKSPTQANYAALAEELVARGEYQDAIPHLQNVLAREPEYCPALYGLAKCHFELGRPAEAIPPLRGVLAEDERWSNYRAWLLQMAALEATGDLKAALDANRELARKSPTTHHLYLLAERLHAAGQLDEAKRVLEQLLEEYHYASRQTRRTQQPWMKKARLLQKSIGAN